MKKLAIAVWNGTGKEGSGYLTSQSSTLHKTKYAWDSRFADGSGTNPEELITAAHAGCFNMKLSTVLAEAGYVPDTLETTSIITMENGTITNSHLVLKARVPGIPRDVFSKYAEDAKENCYISKLLNTRI